MGSVFDTWNEVTGAIYPGAGMSEHIWLYISLAICVVALWVGHRHEGKSYEKAEGGNPLGS